MLPGIRAGARLRAAIAFGVLAIGLVGVDAPSRAARLVDVRMGTHPGYTRVVLETDAPAAFRLEPTGTELRVALNARSRPAAVARATPQVSAIRVEPSGSTTDIHIQLKERVEVHQLVLKKPDRVVLDLYPTKKAAAPAPAPKPTKKAAASKPAPPVAATPAPAASKPAVRLPPPAEKDLAAADKEIPPPAPLPGAATGAASAPAPQAEAAPGAAPGAPEATAEGAPATGEPGSAQAEAPEMPATAPSPPPPPETTRPHVVRPTPEPHGGMGLVDMLLSPAGLGALAAVFLGLFAWLRIRARRAGSPAELAPPGAPDEEEDELTSIPGVVAQPEEDQGPLFDVGEEEVTAGPAPVAPRPVEAEAAAGAPPAAWVEEVGEEMARIIQELERRVGHLETRLEEVVDAKERLERQVSAQTEELRVQRAAIARTQRVLRTVSRPEDEASEPAPKA